MTPSPITETDCMILSSKKIYEASVELSNPKGKVPPSGVILDRDP
jgi:hypothetical protein